METEELLAQPAPAARTERGDNPYVGPRPLQETDKIYGRARELRDLGNLLIAERLVLLYSPSGAGKTSLINAGLVKRLREQEGFRVLPPLRVNLSGIKRAPPHPNRYVRSVAECLMADLTDEECRTLSASAMPCLSDYLHQRPRRAEDGPVDSRFELIIFDQFEEICTLDPTDIDAKEAFFRELGQALRERNRWALFVIREDHLAEIEAFSHLLPTALASRFRLNLLTVDQARQAIAGPAADAGSPFPPEHVERLASELARVTVLHAAGPRETIGITVEPVQLQVVCRRLWQSRKDGGPAAAQEIRAGEVDDALADFYDAVLDKVAREQTTESPHERQRRVRDWIERYLIVKPGIRNQILRGVHETEGLPDDCVSALVSEHLLRVDSRNGRDWIEITHDRMIAPIVNSNERWRKRHLQLYQVRADLWHQNNRSTDMLLSQSDYIEAQHLQKQQAGKPGEIEAAFLEASRKAVAHRRWLQTGYSILLVLMLVAAVMAASLWRQKQSARIEKLNGEALALPQGQYEVTLDKAVDAYALWKELHARDLPTPAELFGFPGKPAPDPLLRNIHAAMLTGLVSVPPVQMHKRIHEQSTAISGGGKAPAEGLSRPAAAVRQLAFNPARRLLAAACADGTVALWNLDQPDAPLERLPAGGQAWSVAFSEAGDLLAVGSTAGTRVWRIAPASPGAGPAAGAIETDLGLPYPVMAVAFDGQGRLATAHENGLVSVRDLAQPETPVAEFRGDGKKEMGVISSITFMKGDKLAFADWRGNIWIWPWRKEGGDGVAAGKTAMLNFFESGAVYKGSPGNNAGIADLAYHAATDQLAAAGWIRKKSDDSNAPGHSHIAVWRDASTAAPKLAERDVPAGRELVSHALAFAPDGGTLAYTGGDSRILSFVANPALPYRARPATATTVRFQERLFSVAFSPYQHDDGNLVAVGDGEELFLLDLRQTAPVAARTLPLAEPFDTGVRNHHAAMSRDGSVVAVAGGAKLEISHKAAGAAHHPVAKPVPSIKREVAALAIAPRGELVAAARSNEVTLFDRNGGEAGRIPVSLCTGALADGASAAYQLAFRPYAGASQLAMANGTSLCIVDLARPGRPRRLPLVKDQAEANIRALAYSADGTRLAVLEGENGIRVHDGKVPGTKLLAPVTRVTTLTFTPNRRYLAFGTSDGDIWFLDVEQRTWSRLDQLHDAGIKSIHFGGQEGAKSLLSTDVEGRLMIWNFDGDTSYNRLGRALRPKNAALPTALSDNGELLLIGGDTPRVFDLRMSTLLGLACEHVNGDKAPCAELRR